MVMTETRLWRPAAQRSVRNAWGYLQAQRSAWSSASAAALSAATNLVNAYLSHSDLSAMDIGVLREMEDIQDKARVKLRSHQEKYLHLYLESYDDLANSVLEMRDLAASMRTYVKDSGGHLVEFCKDPMVDGDTGDGGGVAVFATLPLGVFEMLAKELVTMFQKELKVKWLLASDFHKLVYPSLEAQSLKSKEFHVGDAGSSNSTDTSEPSPPEKELDGVNVKCPQSSTKAPSRETLQVYLTALLAEVHINKGRINEISRLWTEEMGVALFDSPRR